MRTRTWWVAIGLLAVGLVACGPAPSGRPSGPVASPSASAPASAAPTPPASSGATQPCTAGDLALELSPWEGAAGGRFVVLTARTLEDVSCTLAGRPGVALLDRDVEIIIDSATEPGGRPRVEPGDPVVVIGPDRGATVAIGTSNWCGPPPPTPLGILLTLPDESNQGHVSPDGSADDLPPCDGPGQPARIFVQAPWQPEL